MAIMKLSNGHEFEFACASGALAFNGDGWWWEQPFRWFGCLNPHVFTIITKTITLQPRIGNLQWNAPWKCVQYIPGGVVNAVGLTNKGLSWWLDICYPHIIKRGYKVIVSIAPQSIEETKIMVSSLNKCKIVGLQFNMSCPNAKLENNIEIIKTALNFTNHPLSIKFGYEEVSPEFDNLGIDFFELINSVPWNVVFPKQISPLAKYGHSGGVSGKPIIPFARKALLQKLKTPIASGGGIYSLEEVHIRKLLGAA